MAKERFKLICSSYVLLVKDNKILLGKRQNTGYMDEFWHLPAGHKEEGETATECLIREIAEEIGLELNQKNIRFVHAMCRKENDERVDLFFEVKNYKNEVQNMEPEKCSELKWFNLNNLPENTVPYAKHAIECYNQNIFFSEFGWGKQQSSF